MQARIGEYGVALREFMHRLGSQFVRLCHGARHKVCVRKIASRQCGLTRLISRLSKRRRNLLLHFCQGIIGEGVAEILHDVKPVSAADHAQPDHVIGRVEQVRAMRRGLHEMLMALRGIEIEGNVFAFLIELRASFGSQTLREGRLTFEPMGKLTLGNHLFRMYTGGPAHTRVEGQPRRTELRSGLICKIEKQLFGLRIVVAERDIRCDG